MCNRIFPNLLLIVLSVAVFSARSAATEISWWTTHALEKVRPSDPRPAGSPRGVELWAGRNEFEPFQIVLRATREYVSGVDVAVSDLLADDGSIISGSRALVYLEKYLNVMKASSIEGSTGEWPDPLIPRVDRYTGERRNAFPFSLEPGRNQPLWIELYVPLQTMAGIYRGNVRVTANGSPDISVPITLTVWNFDLPSTSSLKTAFGFSGPAALRQHRGRYTTDDDLGRITYLYAKAALLHRISLSGHTMAPPPFQNHPDGMQIEWQRYDSELGQFLDGTVLAPNDPLPGARVTSVDLRTNTGLTTENDRILYWKEWIRHFRQKGWLERLYSYVWDEPSRAVYPEVIQKSMVSHRAGPELKNLLTALFDERLLEYVDIWVPLVNCLDNKPGFPDFCETMITPQILESERRLHKEIWWYQSCASHGCGEYSTNEYFRGWPSYMIDSPAISNRIMSWLTWKYDIGGELYFSVDEAFGNPARDPWKDVYMHGGNGDGTLFYPGRPEVIGGKSDIPIESIRLKLIREGLEDYEYLTLLARIVSRDDANKRVATIVTSASHWKTDPRILFSVRKSIGELLSARSKSATAGKLVGCAFNGQFDGGFRICPLLLMDHS